MQIILARDNIKRSIEAPFAMCMSKSVAIHLAQQILYQCDRENFSYGWISIYGEPLSPADTAPLEWKHI